MLHSALTVPLGNHVVQSWEVADAAALAALAPALADIGKVAYQADTKEFHVLTNNVGPVWGKIPLETSGTWTPTIVGTGTAGANTYTIQAGYWRKHGTVVYVQGRISMATKDAAMSGDVSIRTLPFLASAAANSHASIDIGLFSRITYPASALELTGIILANTTEMRLRWALSNAAATTVVPADLSATTDIFFSATYISNA